MPWRKVNESSFYSNAFPLSVLLMDLIEVRARAAACAPP